MDSITAQVRAVVATAQVAAALPELDVTIRVLEHHVDGDRRWMATVEWTDGPDEDRMRRVLDGPPPGVRLIHRISVPDPDPERSD